MTPLFGVVVRVIESSLVPDGEIHIRVPKQPSPDEEARLINELAALLNRKPRP